MYKPWKRTLRIHGKERRRLGQNFVRNPGGRKRRKANIVSWKQEKGSLPERIHGGDHVFWVALGWLDVWFFGGRHNFSSLSLISNYSFYCFSKSRFPANSMGLSGCRRSGDPKLVFHWSAAWPSWQPLWWGVISFQNSGFIFAWIFPRRKIRYGCVARLPKPLTYLWPKSAIFPTLFMTWPKIWYPIYDLSLRLLGERLLLLPLSKLCSRH